MGFSPANVQFALGPTFAYSVLTSSTRKLATISNALALWLTSSHACSFRILGVVLLLVCCLCSCGADDSTPGPLVNAPSPLAIPTYDGSGQVVEPDVISFESPWQGFRYWMVVSPYPFSDASKENPSILASNDGEIWQVPDGLQNPLALPDGKNYLSDASLFYDRNSDQLWVYYNVTLNPNPSESKVALGMNRLFSSDGVHWNSDGQLFQVPNCCDAVSPTIGKLGNEYIMWSVKLIDGDTPSSILTYRTSTDGLNWSVPQPTDMVQANNVIWHVNITFVPSIMEWWAAVTAFPSGQRCCSNTRLFFSNSKDGIHWTSYAKPILQPSAAGWDAGEIYRSSFLFDPENYFIKAWYSAPDTQGAYHVGFTQEGYDDLLSWLQQ